MNAVSGVDLAGIMGGHRGGSVRLVWDKEWVWSGGTPPRPPLQKNDFLYDMACFDEFQGVFLSVPLPEKVLNFSMEVK